MKTYNHSFSSSGALLEFVSNHGISDSKSLMIQCFDGLLIGAYTQEMLDFLLSQFPNAHIVGASTDGEIIHASSSLNSIVLSFTVFAKSTLSSCNFSLEKDSYQAGVALGREALRVGAKVAIVFTSGLLVNSENFLNGIFASNKELVVSGGVAGDNGEFKETYAMLGSKMYYGDAVAVFISGEALRVHNSYTLNWIPIGPSFKVTSSKDNKLFTLDDIAVVQIYREYLGDAVAQRLPAVGVGFPVLLEQDGVVVGRAPIAMLENDAMIFGGNIPNGSTVRFGIGNAQLILETSIGKAKEMSSYSPETIFVYSCMARRRFMGESINMELSPLKNITDVSGFFTYGEFFTDVASGSKSLFNETMTLLAMSEDDGVYMGKKEFSADGNKNEWSTLTFNALSNLIDKTSIELQILNLSLQRRVDEEIRQNRERDKMMLVQAKRATMGEMISMIAHQWRQPIATIGLIANNLTLDATIGDVRSQDVLSSADSISVQVQHLSKTISDFTDYFRPNDAPEEFMVFELFDEIVAIVGKMLEYDSIVLEADFQSTDSIRSCRRELIQICINLINNSKDAFVNRGQKECVIRFSYRFSSGKHQLRISDNAGGIEASVADRMFEPYFSTKGKQHGTGLGLYMSKIIVQQQLGGDIIHHNTFAGSVFAIIIPNQEVTI